jgi:hypothetical protein
MGLVNEEGERSSASQPLFTGRKDSPGPRFPFWMSGEELRKDFDRDGTIESRAARARRLACSATADTGEDFAGPEASTYLERHRATQGWGS